MSVNKYLPHVLLLPEDDANRQIANGFLLDPSATRQIDVLEVAGGWNEVLRRFSSVYAREMDRNPNRFMILLIDFDGHLDRFDLAKNGIPEHLKDRVFVLGILTEPEDLKSQMGHVQLEAIGLSMAKDCREGTNEIWGHRLLVHNSPEIDRLRPNVCQFLFRPA